MLLQDSDDEPRILGGEDTKEPRTRPRELPPSAGQRLAGDSHLGMPTDTKETRPHDARGGAATQRKPPLALQAPHTNPLLLPRRGTPPLGRRNRLIRRQRFRVISL